MDENPYKSPNDVERELTKTQPMWKKHFGAAAQGLRIGLCCFVGYGLLEGSEVVNPASLNPLGGLVGAVLVPCLVGTIAGWWYLRANEQQRKVRDICLGWGSLGIIAIAFLLAWLFGR